MFKQPEVAEPVELYEGAEPPAEGGGETSGAAKASLEEQMAALDPKKQADEIAELQAQIDQLEAASVPTLPVGQQLQVIGRDGDWLRVLPQSEEAVPHRFWDKVADATDKFKHAGRGVEGCWKCHRAAGFPPCDPA